MKILINKFLIVVLFFFSAIVNAQPPCPGCPPGPPDVPIDDNLIVLLLIGLSFGVYTIYKYKLKTKASV